jgi:hypothetical protein
VDSAPFIYHVADLRGGRRCRRLDHAPKQSHSSHLFTFEAIRQRALVEAVMVRRTGKGYVLTLVGQPPYEGGSGGSTSKGVIFDCEFGGKKGRIVVKCEPENPAKVTKEELDEAIKQAADYLEDELKAGRKPRRRYRLNNGQMFRQKKTRLKASGV